MKITVADVEHVARLARLELTAGEKELFAGQMGTLREKFSAKSIAAAILRSFGRPGRPPP